jgi:hypothetical protein
MSLHQDHGFGSDEASVSIIESTGVNMVADENIFVDVISQKNWKVEWRLEKRMGDWTGEQIDAGLAPEPYEVITVPENGLLNAGIDQMWMQLIGGPRNVYVPFGSGQAYIKVGNGTTAFSAAHTDLQGGSTAEAAMDATYPSLASTTMTWRATFDTSTGNFAWEEVAVKNGSGAVSATVKLLNRKVQSFGTKVSGATWTMSLAITLS